MSGGSKMVDSKEIEELRALAFASIPTVARKAQHQAGGAAPSKGKRKRTSVDTEEGEILSDEDAAAAAVAAASQSHMDVTSASLPTEVVLNVPAKQQKGGLLVSMESSAPVSIETAGLVTVTSSPLPMLRPEEIGDLTSCRTSNAVAAKDENGFPAANRTPTAVNNEEAKSIQQRPIMINALRLLKTIPGVLPSRIPTAPLPAGGVRKEADAFLASLNIPVTASPSHLTGFTGDRNSSLVIKFSDDDSDSDGDQQSQGGKNGSKNRKWTTDGPPNSSSSAVHQMGLSSQSTRGLKSEIDRVKKQIAAIERTKGKACALPASRLSKSTALVEVPRGQVNSKSGQLSTSVTSRTIPVDLESLRQQIAAKESELQLRKQRGAKEPKNTGTAPTSSCLTDALDLTQASNSRFGSPGKSEGCSKSGGMQEVLVDIPTTSGLQVNAAPNDGDGSILKMEEVLNLESVHDIPQQQNSTMCAETTAMESIGVLPTNLAIHRARISQSLESLKVAEVVKAVRSENMKLVPENCGQILTAARRNDIGSIRTTNTPKRKRNESERSRKSSLPAVGSESVKKQKREECSIQVQGAVVSGDGLRLNTSQKTKEGNAAALSDSIMEGNNAATTRPLNAKGQLGQSSERKENLKIMQGLPIAVPTATGPQQKLDAQEGRRDLMLNVSDGTQVAITSSGLMSCANTTNELIPTTSSETLQISSSEEQLADQMKEAPRIDDLVPQQNGIIQSEDTAKVKRGNMDVTVSPIPSPSRAIVETQGDSAVFSGGKKGIQGVFVGPNSTCSSLPVWAFDSQLHNSNMAVFQGVSDQRLEYGHDTLWQWQEEEDLFDKELEEAQQNRRRCEVREHLARRQYRDAQEALHSANLRCEVLYQKREMLSARVKAAQLQMYSNKSSLVSHAQHDERALVTVGSPGYSGRAPLRLGTSLWAREDRKTVNVPLNCRMDQDNVGSEPGSATVMKLLQGSERLGSDDYLVSEATDPCSSGSEHSKLVGFDSSAGEMMETQLDTDVFPPSAYVHEKNVKMGKIIESNGSNNTSMFSILRGMNTAATLPEQLSAQGPQEPSTGPTMKEFGLDSCGLNTSAVLQMNMEGAECLEVDENRLTVATLVEAVHGHGIEKEGHHGFSSASFATDLGRDSTSNLKNSMVNDEINTVLQRQEVFLKQTNSSYISQSDFVQNLQPSLNNEQTLVKNTHGSLSVTLRSPGGEDDIDIRTSTQSLSALCTVHDTDPVNQHGTCLAEALLVENHIAFSELQHDGERMETDIQQTVCQEPLASFSSTYAFPTKMDGQVANATCSENSLHRIREMEGITSNEFCKGPMVKISGGQKVSGDLVIQAVTNLESLGVPTDPGEKLHDGHFEMFPETELGTDPMHTGVHMSLNEDLKSKMDLASSISFVPSASLKVLFSHALNLNVLERTMDIWKQQSSVHVVDQTAQIAPVRYESPLSAFRSHRGSSQPVDVFSTSSNNWMHAINPFKVLCKYEHRGKCNNSECIWQHKRDYTLGSSPILDQLHRNAEITEFQEGAERIERKDLNTTLTELSSWERTDKVAVSPVTSQWRWNAHLTKAPVYRIGPHLMKADCFESPLSFPIWKRQLGFGQPFSALHRQVHIDMPCLLDSSLKLPTLGDGSLSSRHFPLGDRSWIEEEGHHSGSLEDSELLVEAALELIDFDVKVQKSEVRKSVLFVLSRGLEAKPFSVALWVVYLHLLYKWEKSIGEDDLFYHAVQYNKGSYELWMMFINSRGHLAERLEAYESAIVTLGSKIELQGHPLEEKSSFLLDLALQRLNCMCVSDLGKEAVSWIDKLTFLASEDVQVFEKHDTSSTSILLTCLTKHDLCILWICCAYVILESQLPTNMIESLGCKQPLSFQNIWLDIGVRRPYGVQAMRLMQIAASKGKGCLELDSVEFPCDRDFQFAKEVFAANFVQCATVCEGLDCSLTLAEKFFNLYLSSVEIVLLRVQLEELLKGKVAGLDIFEKALTRWPLHQSGKIRLWNQYIGYAFDAKGLEFVKVLLARCAAEIRDSESCRSVSKDSGSVFPPNFKSESTNTLQKGLQSPIEGSNDCIKAAFQLLPSIVKRQLTKGFEFSGQLFSYQDAVFGYFNLAFSEAVNGDLDSARNALHSGLNIAEDADNMQHCLKEIAALTSGGLGSSTVSTPTSHYHKILSLFDRCFIESQLLTAVHPLSKGFCKSIKKRRVRLFVDYLLGPWPTDSSLLNTVLESMYGPTLLPKELLAMKDLVDFTEKLLEVLPNNVRLAASACRAVQSRVDDCNSLDGPATLFWCTSLLVDSLCQASPEAPEPRWVEAGKFLKLLDVDSLLEDFYQLALTVYPFSTSLWHGLLAVSSRTGNLNSAMESAIKKGVKLDLQSTN